jgi:hypothetical protein
MLDMEAAHQARIGHTEDYQAAKTSVDKRVDFHRPVNRQSISHAVSLVLSESLSGFEQTADRLGSNGFDCGCAFARSRASGI